MLKYPLTEKTMLIALDLVSDWDKGNFNQFFQLINVTAGAAREIQVAGGLGVGENAKVPPLSNLLELSVYGLMQINPVMRTRETNFGVSAHTDRWEVLLLQELKNAVANDFAVSEYFLTVNAVGTVINTNGGDLTISAPYQSSATSYGDIVQNQRIENISYEVSYQVREILGHELLDTHPELRLSLDEVENSTQINKMSSLGSLLSNLANLVTIGEAIPTVSRAIELVGKAISLVS